ncbi:MAG: cobyrinate a,c-diamide synthase [Nitrospirae bacterium]|nr:MAG: cobyrinate a,c-diamide synthase [Nitrospirota bacterium]
MNGVVIAGTHSGCGKTTAALGIMAALKKKGLQVQPFKAGPDFIDSGLHRLAAGLPSRNLDLWMCGEEYVKELFDKLALNADISVVEGVMGLYDGQLSTAKLASVLDLPVILIVDAYGMAESAGAVVRGFASHSQQSAVSSQNKDCRLGTADYGLSFLGVIFNRVASDRHYERLKDSVRDVNVLGYLPRDMEFEIPHRHLGLHTAEEGPFNEEQLTHIAETVLEFVDVDELIRLSNPPLPLAPSVSSPCPLPRASDVKIAVAYDKAFCFYYQDNLDLLREAGAEIVMFSPLDDADVPEGADAVYFGGGYPELYASQLSQNTLMLRSVFELAEKGMPLYAECGGLMYLSQGIEDFNGKFFKMSGIFDFRTCMTKGRAHLGYRHVVLKKDCMLGKKDEVLKGHEFHYSAISGFPKTDTMYSIKDSAEYALADEGYSAGNTIASYVHLHFGSNKNISRSFVDFIKETRWKT